MNKFRLFALVALALCNVWLEYYVQQQRNWLDQSFRRERRYAAMVDDLAKRLDQSSDRLRECRGVYQLRGTPASFPQ